MSYTVYILHSEGADRYYIGQTADINNRLVRHNTGSEKATAPYTPWQLIWTTQKATRAEAMQLEKKLKNLSRLRLQAFIEKYS